MRDDFTRPSRRSAPAACSRGLIVSAASSSTAQIATLPTGAVSSSHGQRAPLVTAEATAIATWLLAVPGSPVMSVSLPTAMRPGHSQVTGSIVIAAASRSVSAGGAYGSRSGRFSLNFSPRGFGITARPNYRVTMLEIAIPLIVGFALGYGVREWISYRRHQQARERRSL